MKKQLVTILLMLTTLLVPFSQSNAQSPILSAEVQASPPAVGLDGQVRVQIPLRANSDSCAARVRSLPLDVMLVLDRSGSMDDDSWRDARDAAQQFINAMNPDSDRVGVVTFASSAQMERRLTDDLAGVINSADSWGDPGGGTDIRDGIETAGDELIANVRPDAAAVIVLMSDGNDDNSAIREAESYRAAGVRIITIGLGDNVESDLLIQVASTPSDYYPAPTSADLGRIYTDIAETIQSDIGVTTVTVSQRFDDTYFELISGSIAPPATSISGNEISWDVETISDDTPVVLRYRLRAIQAGAVPVAPTTDISFVQCEDADNPQTLTPDSPTVTIIPPPDPPAVFPALIPGEVCELQCVEEVVRVEIPNVENELTVRQLDVAFLFDLSGSMRDELNVVKRESADILSDLRDIVADTNFAAASFVDYPGFRDSRVGGPYGASSDYAWRLDQDITDNTRLISDAFSRMLLRDGEDVPEAYSRALHEASLLSWRPGAQRMVLLFGDAIPHDRTFFSEDTGIDPGADGIEGTADDLDLRTVVAELAAANISVLAIDTNGGSNTAVTQFMRYVAEETGGQYIALSEAESLPETIQMLVGGQVASINNVRLAVEPAHQDWLTFAPSEYDNILYDGRTLEFRTNFCPYQADAERGDYTFGLNVLVDEEPIASVPVEITYRPICLPPVDLFVADHPADDGTDCSNLAGESFWSTPDIITRQVDDSGRESEPLRVGRENFIYVLVHNRGYDPVDDASVTLLWSDGTVGAADAVEWREIGTQTLSVAGESESWSEAFAWTPPTTEAINFLVRVRSSADEIELAGNVACENNLATFNRQTTNLETPSLRVNSVGGDAGLRVTGGESADLLLDFSAAPANASVEIQLDRSSAANWSGIVDGATATAQGARFTGGKQIVLRELPLDRVGTTELTFQIVTNTSSQPFEVEARLRSADVDLGGSTIEVVPIESPRFTAISNPTVQADPRIVSGILLAVIVIVTLFAVGFLYRRLA